MPFQGNSFVRNQNFVRDRNAGLPDATIQAQLVDDEFGNVAQGLTSARVAAATADDKAEQASARATTEANNARSDIRGGVDAAYDTLQKLYTWTKGQVDNLTDLVTRAAPSGQFGMFFTNTAPAGWLVCDGRAVSRTEFAKLYAAIGSKYGGGDGSTTFNLPNATDDFFRASGATAVGVKGDQSIQSHGHTGSTSSYNHSHTGSTSSHSHAHSGSTSVDSHLHSFPIYAGDGGRAEGAGGNGIPSVVAYRQTDVYNHAHSFGTSIDTHSHSLGTTADTHAHSVTVNATGGQETRPRFMALLTCIKT